VYVGTGKYRIGQRSDERQDLPSGSLVNLRSSDGHQEWRRTTAPIAERPIVDDGRVYTATGYRTGLVGARDQRVTAVASDGTRRWATDSRDQRVSVVAAADGSVFAGTMDDYVQADSETLLALRSDGSVAWERRASDALAGTIVDGHLLYPTAAEALTAYDTETGTKEWEVKDEPLGNPTTSIAAFDGVCFTRSSEEADGGQPLVARSTADGSALWRYGGPSAADGDFNPTAVTDNSRVVDDGTGTPPVVGTGSDGVVFSLHADGTERWTFTASDSLQDGPVVGDLVYVCDASGTVYALEPSDGTLRWRASFDDPVSVRPLPNGVLAISHGEDDQTLASLRADGSERWRHTSSKDLTAPAIRGDRVYVGAADGTVLAFAADGSS